MDSESVPNPPPPEPPPLHTGWERERETERAKVNVRWFAIALLFGVLQYIRRHDPAVHSQVSNVTATLIAAAALLMTALEALYLWGPGRQEIHPACKYITVLGDMAFVSVLIYYTGYTRSPFFFVYFVFLISNCLRYGFLMSLYVALLFNILYVIVLGMAPAKEVEPSVLGGESLKVIAFWSVAFYGGAISARIRRQANQLRVYEETILELRERLNRPAPEETEREGKEA